MPKLAILIMGTDRDPWKALRMMQFENWAAETKEVSICYFEGRNSTPIGTLDSFHEYLRWSAPFGRGLAVFDRIVQMRMRVSDLPDARWDKQAAILRLSIPDLYLTGGMKFMGALKWAIEEFDPEWIYRTNVSSFVNIQGLLGFVNDRQPERYYGGSPVLHPRGQFASGSNFLLSRDVADLVLASRNRWQHRYLEDLALGMLLGDLKVQFNPISSRLVTSAEQVHSLSDDELLDVWHYRCKSVSADGSRLDGNIMRALHLRFKALYDADGGDQEIM